jgi:hypothetical protein
MISVNSNRSKMPDPPIEGEKCNWKLEVEDAGS